MRTLMTTGRVGMAPYYRDIATWRKAGYQGDEADFREWNRDFQARWHKAKANRTRLPNMSGRSNSSVRAAIEAGLYTPREEPEEEEEEDEGDEPQAAAGEEVQDGGVDVPLGGNASDADSTRGAAEDAEDQISPFAARRRPFFKTESPDLQPQPQPEATPELDIKPDVSSLTPSVVASSSSPRRSARLSKTPAPVASTSRQTIEDDGEDMTAKLHTLIEQLSGPQRRTLYDQLHAFVHRKPYDRPSA